MRITHLVLLCTAMKSVRQKTAVRHLRVRTSIDYKKRNVLMSVMWTLMLVASLILMIINNPSGAVNAMIAGANGAVTLSINLLALYAFWLGLFNIIERLGVARALDRLLSPVINKLFPGANTEARKYITMNISANLLGLGNAATPMAIKAIGALDDGGKKANTNMIMLTVISATSLQILPTTIIGLRASLGSANPADFLLPSLIATTVSTAIGIILVKLISRLERRFKGVKTHAKTKGGEFAMSEVPKNATLLQVPSAPQESKKSSKFFAKHFSSAKISSAKAREKSNGFAPENTKKTRVKKSKTAAAKSLRIAAKNSAVRLSPDAAKTVSVAAKKGGDA